MTVLEGASGIIMPELTDLFQVDLNETKVVFLHERVYERLDFVVVKLVNVLDFTITIVYIAI